MRTRLCLQTVDSDYSDSLCRAAGARGSLWLSSRMGSQFFVFCLLICVVIVYLFKLMVKQTLHG